MNKPFGLTVQFCLFMYIDGTKCRQFVCKVKWIATKDFPVAGFECVGDALMPISNRSEAHISTMLQWSQIVTNIIRVFKWNATRVTYIHHFS